MKIAEKMSQIHTLDIPLPKEPVWIWNTMDRWLSSIEKSFASTQINNNNNDETSVIETKLRNIDFRQEVEWLRNMIDSKDFPVAFSHNDLQEGNILFRERMTPSNSIEGFGSFDETTQLDSDFRSIILRSNSVRSDSIGNESIDSLDLNDSQPRRKRSFSNDDSAIDDSSSTLISETSTNNDQDDDVINDNDQPELMIIDFEYCAYNYRAFDIANHFLEWTFDYTNEAFPYFYHRKDQYPTEIQKVNDLKLNFFLINSFVFPSNADSSYYLASKIFS